MVSLQPASRWAGTRRSRIISSRTRSPPTQRILLQRLVFTIILPILTQALVVVAFQQLPSWGCSWGRRCALLPPPPPAICTCRRPLSTSSSSSASGRLHMSDDWSSFQALEDDEDDDVIVFGKRLDKTTYAVEDDAAETKAAVGASRSAPKIEWDAEPIQVLAGSQLELTEETVLGVLSACRGELGTLFGYSAENRGVGITGGVDYVDMDGPTVIVKLKGRFWHQRTTVLDRVANYLQQRIPEIVDVQVEDPWQLTDEANEVS